MLISFFFFLPGLKDVILPHISLCLLNLVIPRKWMLYEMRSWHFSWDFFKLGHVSPQNTLNNITKSGHSNLMVESPRSRERKIGFRSRRSGSEFHPGPWWAMPPGQGIQPRKQWVLVANIWSSGANLPGLQCQPNHLLAVWFQVNCSNSLILSFLYVTWEKRWYLCLAS